jgi:hypothetical protein
MTVEQFKPKPLPPFEVCEVCLVPDECGRGRRCRQLGLFPELEEQAVPLTPPGRCPDDR